MTTFSLPQLLELLSPIILSYRQLNGLNSYLRAEFDLHLKEIQHSRSFNKKCPARESPKPIPVSRSAGLNSKDHLQASQDLVTELQKAFNSPRDKLYMTPNMIKPCHYLSLDATLPCLPESAKVTGHIFITAWTYNLLYLGMLWCSDSFTLHSR